jgi:hypothetical protein
MAKCTAVEGKPKPNVAEQILLDACGVNGLVKDYGKGKCIDTIANAYRVIGEAMEGTMDAPHTPASAQQARQSQ